MNTYSYNYLNLLVLQGYYSFANCELEPGQVRFRTPTPSIFAYFRVPRKT